MSDRNINNGDIVEIRFSNSCMGRDAVLHIRAVVVSRPCDVGDMWYFKGCDFYNSDGFRDKEFALNQYSSELILIERIENKV